MINNTLLSLSYIGFSQYALSESGELYKMPASVQVNKDNINRLRLTSDNGITIRITLKKLYRLTFNKEFSVDTIQNLPHEEWKEIENTKGKYFISNCGRVKSLCGYTAKILQQYKKRNGYLIAKINGKKVFAVGVTVVRALETPVTTTKQLKPFDGWTNKFIFPPYSFSIPDAMVTNFHMPGSTMLMSAAAFGGFDNVMRAYKEALNEGYKFGMYGDAMLII